MDTILVFGFEKSITEIKTDFSEQAVKIFQAESLSEFNSLAFSRVFDLWIINPAHPDCLKLPFNRYSVGTSPFVFFMNSEDPDFEPPMTFEHQAIIEPDTETDSLAERFLHLKIQQHTINKERFLAGIINSKPGLEALITQAPPMFQLIDFIKDIAPTESALLLYGETGTGKELFANVIHNESRRRTAPFMAVNCGALPDTLLESELFGYEKGAFTGADGRRIGKIEHASGGTLFLDEIEAMSEAMQVKLLRVLQEKSLQRLGTNVEVSTDFRLISATNADPRELLKTSKLRSDLYYRIAVFSLRIPPLRERSEDIPLLASHFLNKKKKDGRNYVQGINSRAMKLLSSATWNGNIRELQNVIERAVMLADTNMIRPELIEIPSLSFPETHDSQQGHEKFIFKPGISLKSYKSKQLRAIERRYLIELLRYTNGRIGEAAQLCGLTSRALYNKMKKYNLKKEDFKRFELIP